MNPVVCPWEQGSEFHLMENFRKGERSASPWDRNRLLFGTGRDAIKALLILGMASRGWKRLWIPAYFCQGVVHTLLETRLEVSCYRSWYPGERREDNGPCVEEGDVVLVVNHFGLKTKNALEFTTSNAVAIIEDHTHDPWSPWAFNSKADYCIASLRKTLPIPDGAVLWSPTKRGLPVEPALTEEHRLAAGNKLDAMKLKGSFLRGEITDKSRFRTLSLSGESNLCGRDISAIAEWTAERLDEFPVFDWREARKRNHQILADAVSPQPWVQVLSSSPGTDIVPFSCILLFDCPKRREFVRINLIRANIYPAILWPLGEPAIQGIPEDHVDASKRMLSIHCDMRYSAPDLLRVADCICRFGQEFDT